MPFQRAVRIITFQRSPVKEVPKRRRRRKKNQIGRKENEDGIRIEEEEEEEAGDEARAAAARYGPRRARPLAYLDHMRSMSISVRPNNPKKE